jgi:hypothetical protein
MEIMAGSGMMAMSQASESTEQKTKLYLMETYILRQGSQLNRMHNYFSQAALPALNKLHAGPKIVLEAIIAPHLPQVVVFLGFESIAEMWSLKEKLNGDQDLRKAFEAWQNGPEPPFERQENVLLEATSYSRDITPLTSPPKSSGRIFELRIYHSPTWQQLEALHERFSQSEVGIFHRVGVNPLFYSATLIGPDMPNLTYLIPFDSLAAREKAWDTFASDPEWIKVRKESIDRYGQIVSTSQVSLFKAVPYSPIQ